MVLQPSILKNLMSWFRSSCTVLPLILALTENISIANSSISSPAIPARNAAVALSLEVVVGDWNLSVSDRIAPRRSPARFLGNGI